MLMHGPTIFYALDYRSVSTFHRQSRYGGKILFLFCRWSSSLHMTKRRSTSLGFNSHGTQCPCFWTIPNTLKRFVTVDSSTCNLFPSPASVWNRSSSNISSNSLSSNFFGAPERSLSSSLKLLFLKRRNQSLHVVSDTALSPQVSTKILCAPAADLLWIK